MSIEIKDGFKVNRSVPIDDRIVASNLMDRDNIAYKYNGLRTFVLSDQTPYVLINNTWKKELENSLVGTSLKNNYLVKFNDVNKGLTNSSIIDTGSCVFINPTTPLNVVETSIKLNVNGVVKALTFFGIGTNLTNLNASEIKSGLMDVKYIKPSNENQIFISQNKSLKWEYSKNLSISLFSINQISNKGKYEIVLNKENEVYKNSNINGIYYNSGVNQILAKNLTKKPTYSFIDDDLSGFYLNDGLTFKVLDDDILKIQTGSILLLNGDNINPSISFKSGENYGLYSNITDEYIGFSTNGSDAIKIFSDKLKVNKKLLFIGDQDTGIVNENNSITLKNRNSNITINSEEISFTTTNTFISSSSTVGTLKTNGFIASTDTTKNTYLTFKNSNRYSELNISYGSESMSIYPNYDLNDFKNIGSLDIGGSIFEIWGSSRLKLNFESSQLEISNNTYLDFISSSNNNDKIDVEFNNLSISDKIETKGIGLSGYKNEIYIENIQISTSTYIKDIKISGNSLFELDTDISPSISTISLADIGLNEFTTEFKLKNEGGYIYKDLYIKIALRSKISNLKVFIQNTFDLIIEYYTPKTGGTGIYIYLRNNDYLINMLVVSSVKA